MSILPEPLTVLVVADPHAGFLGPLSKVPSSVEVVIGDSPAAFQHRVDKARVLVNCFQPLKAVREIFIAARHLEWVHSLRAGTENSLFSELITSPIPFTTSRGVSSRPLAEFVLAGALFFNKKLDEMRRHQREGRWVKMDIGELSGRTIGLLGYGSIGQHIARLANAFDMNVIACSRQPDRHAVDPFIIKFLGSDHLQSMLREADFVVVCCPLTNETQGMIGEEELAAMKPDAILINVARGPIVVEEALIKALTNNRLGGAVLDVYDTEPLPAGHPFYSLENVLMSTHSANRTHDWRLHAMDVFIDNLERFLRNQPLLNVVNKVTGY